MEIPERAYFDAGLDADYTGIGFTVQWFGGYEALASAPPDMQHAFGWSFYDVRKVTYRPKGALPLRAMALRKKALRTCGHMVIHNERHVIYEDRDMWVIVDSHTGPSSGPCAICENPKNQRKLPRTHWRNESAKEMATLVRELVKAWREGWKRFQINLKIREHQEAEAWRLFGPETFSA